MPDTTEAPPLHELIVEALNRAHPLSCRLVGSGRFQFLGFGRLIGGVAHFLPFIEEARIHLPDH